MDFSQDQNTGKALLKIPDRTVRKHREMWGLFCSHNPFQTFIFKKSISLLRPLLLPLRGIFPSSLLGTTRAYLQNHILGVSEGHSSIIRMVGVGFRATVEDIPLTGSATLPPPEYPGQQLVSLKCGFTHPVELAVPWGMKCTTPQPTRILLEGIEKTVVNQFAADIRKWRKPEPYKGKGIFVNGETIKLKAKRIK